MARHIFTADLHLGHANIIKYCNRPFASVDEMDRTIIDNWNAVVQPSDTVWMLGDFAHNRADPRVLRRLFSQLRGSKHLIAGNHDDKRVKDDLPWSSVRDYAEITVEGVRVVLSHYALRSWNGMRHGSIQLYGHSHGGLPGTAQSLDVGVDPWCFRPVTFPEIQQRLATLPALSFDAGEPMSLLEVEGLEGGEVMPFPPV